MLNRHATLALATISTEAMQLRQGLAQIEVEAEWRDDYNECMMSGGSTTECYDLSWGGLAQVGAERGGHGMHFWRCVYEGKSMEECSNFA